MKDNIIKKILHEFNYVTWYDIKQIIVFIVSLPIWLIFKIYIIIFKKEIWLICEDKNEARDNGFCFFEYLNKYHKEVNSYYAINKKSKDYDKVKKIGKVIQYGSIKHWVYYLSAKYNISSQKGGKPSAAICYVLEVTGILKNKRIFLQHGITINKQDWLNYKNTKMRLFVCGAQPEYEYIKTNFGYPENYVKYLGFSRFDNYHNIKVNKKQIVFMPTWREWIASKNEYSSKYDNGNNFKETEYYKKCMELLENKKLISFLESNQLIFYFYPHRNMQKYIKDFKSHSKQIRIVNNQNSEIKDLLIDSAIMITDYSSVSMDFAYMKKPIIYYQFDEERFRTAQYQKGYFDYRKDGFGKVFTEANEVVNELINIYNENMKMSEKYLDRHSRFFTIYDNKNSERIFEEIKKIK